MNRVTLGAKLSGFLGTAQAYWSLDGVLQRVVMLRLVHWATWWRSRHKWYKATLQQDRLVETFPTHHETGDIGVWPPTEYFGYFTFIHWAISWSIDLDRHVLRSSGLLPSLWWVPWSLLVLISIEKVLDIYSILYWRNDVLKENTHLIRLVYPMQAKLWNMNISPSSALTTSLLHIPKSCTNWGVCQLIGLSKLLD